MGPALGCAPGWPVGLSAGVAARVEVGQVGLLWPKGLGGVSIQEFAVELQRFPLPPFLKAKAVIYSPFRFSECSLCELDVQTPPQGAGEREVEPERRGPAGAPRPSAPLVPAHSGPRRAQLAARTQKHKSVP